MQKAKRLVSYLETHARRVYAAGTVAEAAAAKAILHHIRKGDLKNGFKPRDIQRRGWANLSDREAVQAGLDLLCDLDWIAPQEQGSGAAGGQPKLILPHARHPAGRFCQFCRLVLWSK